MTDLCRKWTITSAIVLTVIGLGLSIGAILTPSWQVVNLREYNSIHEHGLWLDCTRHSRDQNVLLRRWAMEWIYNHFHSIPFFALSSLISFIHLDTRQSQSHCIAFTNSTTTNTRAPSTLRTTIRRSAKWIGTSFTVSQRFLTALMNGFVSGWHTATLVLLALALITAFTSVCIGVCGCCYASLSLVFTAVTLLTSNLLMA